MSKAVNLFAHMPMYARVWSGIFFVLYLGHSIKLLFAGNALHPMIYPAIAFVIGYIPIYLRFLFSVQIRIVVLTSVSVLLCWLLSGPLENFAARFLESEYSELTLLGQVAWIVLGGIFDFYEVRRNHKAK